VAMDVERRRGEISVGLSWRRDLVCPGEPFVPERPGPIPEKIRTCPGETLFRQDDTTTVSLSGMVVD